MKGYYHLTEERSVNAANYMTYICGSLHPDRVMPEHDLVYLSEGQWEIWQNDQAYTLEADDVIILHAGHHHYGRQPCHDGTKTMFFHCGATAADDYAGASVKEEWELSDGVVLPTLIHCRQKPIVKKLFAEIISARFTDLPHKTVKISLMVNLLFSELSECQEDGSDACSRVVAEAVNVIRSMPHQFLSTRDIASQLYISEKTLVNRFKQVHGISVYRYQLTIRLEMARDYLSEHAAANLREVALNFGFYDEFHFSKHFKKKYGMAPRDYRRHSR